MLNDGRNRLGCWRVLTDENNRSSGCDFCRCLHEEVRPILVVCLSRCLSGLRTKAKTNAGILRSAQDDDERGERVGSKDDNADPPPSTKDDKAKAKTDGGGFVALRMTSKEGERWSG